MDHEKLIYMRETLTRYIECQLYNLEEVDTEELGEAIDMLKDIEEAIYYCTITKAMEGTPYDYGPQYRSYMDDYPNHWQSKSPKKHEKWEKEDWRRMDEGWDEDYPPMIKPRDHREGRSPEMRRMYMENREHGVDKTAQMHELEKYMQELTSDIVEMIQEASLEEKQYLEKKLVALSSKIGQMK